MSGAALLSSAILQSGKRLLLQQCVYWRPTHTVDSTVIRANNDLTVQLNSRKEKISFLIKFINENGVLSKVSALVFTSRSFSNFRPDVPAQSPTSRN